MRRAGAVLALAMLAACEPPKATGEAVRPRIPPSTPQIATTTTEEAFPAESVEPATTTVPEPGSALASWYARGARAASGERFNPDGMTFAHLTLAFGTMVTFCRADDPGRCVTGRCTDRGPAAWTGKQFDLSRAMFSALAPLSAGVVTVTWEVAG